MTGETAEDRSTKPQVGRPRCPAETARRNRVVTMVTDAELEKLKTVADTERQSVSALVHEILSKHFGRQE